jgi:hypothetical protein
MGRGTPPMDVVVRKRAVVYLPPVVRAPVQGVSGEGTWRAHYARPTDDGGRGMQLPPREVAVQVRWGGREEDRREGWLGGGEETAANGAHGKWRATDGAHG